ncbi:MFS transporter [Frankia sp. CNm7]|uniref:MFS transporter n=1 Tax=Frankia nepalensis TaxID=1836974 RepID=A0A937RKF8_9ACTN|nr:MFS transporter [Frankia nepalensis]MBL7497278.1 MFS transporter [Frankia nepalensis]MBL7512147.1 MFS transporter [Frankia nepalensis]MBL7520372.1 MFS transporter [Frankia nepalensis]MBL7631917.1 MFS transporter [Frankia nepalensis]
MTLTGESKINLSRGTWRIPRSRGALAGLLLMALGVWGTLIPFVGPAFNFGFGGAQTWNWSAARFWLEVLPGIATFVGGLLLTASANRGTAMIGAWLAIAAGAWFVIGPTLAGPWHLGDLGTPMGSSGRQAMTWLLFFYALGAVILYLASTAQGRLSVRSLRDIEHAQMRAQRKMAARGAHGGLFGGGRARKEEPARVGGGDDRDYRDERATRSARDERADRADRSAGRDVYPSDTRADRAEPTTRRGTAPADSADRDAGHDVYPSDTARASDNGHGRHEAQHEGLGGKIGRTLAKHGIGGRH